MGNGAPCCIIAEGGVNHDGLLDRAVQLADAAKAAGASAIKIQTFRSEKLVSPNAPKAAYQLERTGAGESQLDMLRRLELSEADHRALAAHCAKIGLAFFSTPFDEASADFLVELGVPAIKIGSGDLTNHPLIRHVARKQIPLILSTGMATMDEVDATVRILKEERCSHWALLHCVSAYPADVSGVNLRAMNTLRDRFGVPVGYSDHTRGIEIPIAAVAMGAAIIEKHITLSRSMPGPDHAVSLEPMELKALVYAIRNVEKALGDGCKKPVEQEQDTARVARRSLFAARDLPPGAVLIPEMVVMQRPGNGLPPSMLDELTGKSVVRPVRAGEMLCREMFA